MKIAGLSSTKKVKTIFTDLIRRSTHSFLCASIHIKIVCPIWERAVYDITEYLDYHPGGPDTIYRFAGDDATIGFNSRMHSRTARKILTKYLIGVFDETATDPLEVPRVITYEDVAKHNHTGSTWVVLFEKVYDLTPFVSMHPGGEAPIIEAAGTNATKEFKLARHPQSAFETLKKYYIGEIDKKAKDKEQETSKKNLRLFVILSVAFMAVLFLGFLLLHP